MTFPNIKDVNNRRTARRHASDFIRQAFGEGNSSSIMNTQDDDFYHHQQSNRDRSRSPVIEYDIYQNTMNENIPNCNDSDDDFLFADTDESESEETDDMYQNTMNENILNCNDSDNENLFVDTDESESEETEDMHVENITADNSPMPEDQFIPIPANQSKREKLAAWATDTKQTRRSLNLLLEFLREEYDSTLPRDSRTLLETPRNISIHDMDNGQYLEIGLEKMLLKFMENHELSENNIYIDINVDGVPIAKSSSNSLWPILINVVGSDEVLCVGCFFGSQKPQNVNNYLNRFVVEFLSLHRHGLNFNGILYSIHIRAIIADAPARAFLLNIRTYTGYWSCNKCHIKGRYILNRMTFPNSTFTARNDTEFRTKEYDQHHVNSDPTAIESLPIDCVKNIAIDYMHACLEGVLKQLMVQWMLIRRKSYSMRKNKIQDFSNNIIIIADQLPSEFERTPRPLKYFKRFKGTEFRQLLLYTLPILIYNLIDESIYNHFLKIHCAIRILCSRELHLKLNELASDCLTSFVEEYDSIYDDHQYSFNIHSLLHLCEDVIYFQSPLDSFSSFKFENHLQFLKNLVRSGNNPLKQIHNRYAEKFKFQRSTNNQNQHKKLSKKKDGSYKYIYLNQYKFACEPPNNYCYDKINKYFIKILRINDSMDSSYEIHGRKVLETLPIYTEPIDSRELGLHTCVEMNLNNIEIFKLNINIVKAGKIKMNNKLYLFTLIH